MHAIRLPPATAISAPFWSGLCERRLRLQRCSDRGHWVFYPRRHCPRCAATALDWHEVSGQGRLLSYTIARVPPLPEFTGPEPVVLAVVELDEGVHLNTNLVDVAPEAIAIGMRVAPVFVPALDHAGSAAMRLCFAARAETQCVRKTARPARVVSADPGGQLR
ncbi:MAG: Zn-ribbon domain-containing OB-fold protein [Gammaproteobacteria bacterium]|nr:Zn-ribbon domain-containing OB-fold protein [Gammaproteobacteria bacterium]